MALHIVDRRLAGKNKSIGNRERFLNRQKEQIREAVRKAVAGRSIREIEQAENITIPRKNISEPVFHHGQGGVRDTVHPGNVDHLRGDRIRRPKGGAAGGGCSMASRDALSTYRAVGLAQGRCCSGRRWRCQSRCRSG